MNKKRLLAKLWATSETGKIRQLQFIVYLSFLLNIVFTVVMLIVLWELRV
ncbi:hypothetical protein IV487_01895 [Enterococcus saccharolyticus]|nr:hypothetical protein [Enterococcus saccharolyticus]MCD5001216.1 hypothetical protein [Enterococcus saccharolyticus]